ncbi:MAG: GDP-mannose mannosyl hydrolase [Candidatus Saccharibacteria bacterium]|nr:GDP-mannose mannosyl hydrolase [Candidatus Saccharibacteria bacterium]
MTHVVAKLLIKNIQGQVLLIKRSETDTRRPLQWDIPGGFVEQDEDFVAAAVREAKEESGLIVNKEACELVYTKTAMTPHGNTAWLFFVTESNVTDIRLSHEHVEHTWVTVGEALEMIEYPLHKEVFDYIRQHNLLL